jgi:hypothetical protein
VITYAGVGVSEQTPDLARRLADWWRPEFHAQTLPDTGSLAGLDHLPLTPDAGLCPKLGVLRWPVGASRWATFSALVTAAQWDEIAAGTGPRVLTLDDGTGSVSPEMYALPARPVCRSGDGAADLFLLTLVDERYWWWSAGAGEIAAAPTWADLFAGLFGLVGVTPTVETVPAAYLTPTGRWDVGRKPVPAVLDAAALSVGARVVRTLTGDVKVVRPATALANQAALWELYGDRAQTGGAVDGLGRGVPAAVEVVFFGDPADSETVTLSSLALAEYGDETGEAGKTGVVWPDVPATATAPERTAAADRAAEDWYRWQAGKYEGTLGGVADWQPTGLEDVLEWGFAGGRAFTAFTRPPAENVWGDDLAAGGGAAGRTMIVPLAFATATLPTGCDDVDAGTAPFDRTDQCWGPYYFALIVTWDATCGAWAAGDCVFLLSVTGQRLVLGQRYPGWLVGDPPASVKGAGVPLGFPCSDMTAARLYGTYSRESRTIYVGSPYTKCPTPGTGGYVQFYEATAQVWQDCSGWTTVETGYVADVNGCPLTPGVRVDGQFERMLLGSEVGGAARSCVPFYTVKREKNQQIDLRCEGGNLNLYAPSALDPCGDTLVFSKTVGCCDPTCGGGGGGGGGSASCCSRTLNSTLRVSVAGEGVFNITWDGSAYWKGSALLSCGETLWIRMAASGCGVEFSCVGTAGTWSPAAGAIGSPTCTPKFISVRWTINMDDTGTPGCITGKCGSSIDLYIQEP